MKAIQRIFLPFAMSSAMPVVAAVRVHATASSAIGGQAAVSAAILGAGIFLGVLLSLSVINRNQRFLLHMASQTLLKIAQGDLSARLGKVDWFAKNRLVSEFNDVLRQLCENYEELRIREERYRVVMQQKDNIIFEYNISDQSWYYASEWLGKLGFAKEGYGKNGNSPLVNFIYSNDLPAVEGLISAMVNGQKKARCEMRIQLPSDERMLWCSMRMTTLFDQSGKPCKVVGRISDIDSKKRETEALKTSAQQDSLTGLYNKMTTEHMINSYLNGEGKGDNHALFILDIDNFKKINDSFGHLAGDTAIRDMANTVLCHFRETDICGRIGGDEIVVLMKRFGCMQALEEKAKTLIKAMHYSIEGENGETITTSSSVGISIYPRDGQCYTELFVHADAALYQAKNNGKNQFCIADPLNVQSAHH